MENLIGKTLDNYQINAILGKGGMGIVYEAYDIKLDRKVAIKVMSSQLFDNPRFIERFKREAKNQAKLIHQNIVTVYGFMEHGDFLGIVMEFVEGESLEKVIYRQKRLHLYDVLYIMKQCLAGIGYAHSKGFIHRDIKPSNIVFNKEGIAKIMDFGISKSLFEKGITQTGAKVGTVYYMSPEQIKGVNIDHRTDIYSLGCTFYEMLVGRPPFVSETDYEIMDSHLKKDIKKISEVIPGTPKIIDDILMKSMHKDVEQRYRSCGEFLQAVKEAENYIKNLKTQTTTKVKKSKKKIKQYSLLAFSGFIVITLFLAYFIYTQVDQIIKSPEALNTFRKYSFQNMFQSDESMFSSLSKQSTGTNFALRGISFNSGGVGIAVGDSGTVVKTDSYGKLWYDIDLGTKNNFNDVFIMDDGRSFIVGENSTFFYSTDFFKEIKSFPLPAEKSLFKIHFEDNNLGFILGSKGLVLRTINGGKEWSRVNLNTTNLLYDMAFIDRETGFIVGWSGMILKTTNRGNSWIEQKAFTRSYLRAIDFYEDIGITVGGGGTIFRTDDAGENWIQIQTKNSGSLQEVKFLNEDVVFAAGSKGLILISKDTGETWHLFDTKTFINYTDIEVDAEGSVFLSGVNGTIVKLK